MVAGPELWRHHGGRFPGGGAGAPWSGGQHPCPRCRWSPLPWLMVSSLDALVVGSGPNGLAAAITLARAGLDVRSSRASDTPGGGCRTAELTLPGFRHDVCSAVHPLAASSPFFTSIDLAARGSRVHPKVAFAHPLDGGRAAAVAGSVEETAGGLGRDAGAYRRLLGPLVRDVGLTLPEILAPIRSVPRHPLAMARFGLAGLPPATAWPAGSAPRRPGPVRRRRRTLDAAAERPGDRRVRAAARRWRARGGLAGGRGRQRPPRPTRSGRARVPGRRGGNRPWVRSLDELPPARAILLDVTPRQLIALAGDRLTGTHRAALSRFRYGPGVCKVDWALSGPVPWPAAGLPGGGTVHLGGHVGRGGPQRSRRDRGRHAGAPVLPRRPARRGRPDPRARRASTPCGRTATCRRASRWTCPARSRRRSSGSRPASVTSCSPGHARQRRRQERTTPTTSAATSTAGPGPSARPCFRPTPRWNPYRTAIPGVYLCSASTPPGGGVHGMCG